MARWWWFLAFAGVATLGAAQTAPIPWEQLRQLPAAGVRALVNQGLAFSTDQDRQRAVAQIMSVNPDPEVLPVLLEAGADLQGLSANYNGLEAAVAKNANPKVVEALNRAGLRPRYSLTQLAVQFNPNLAMLQALAGWGAPFNQVTNDEGLVSALLAGETPSPEKLEFLLQNGAPPDVKFRGQRVLLGLLASRGPTDPYIDLLLRYGASWKPLPSETRHPADLALDGGHAAALSRMFQLGWDLKNPDGNVNLRWFGSLGGSLAADFGRASGVAEFERWLALAPAQETHPLAKAVWLQLPAQVSAGRTAVVLRLLDWGKSLKLGRASLYRYQTPLLALMAAPDSVVAALFAPLAAAGADPRVGEDRAALYLATRDRNAATVAMLLKAGAHPEVAVQQRYKDTPESPWDAASRNKAVASDAAVMALLAPAKAVGARLEPLKALSLEFVDEIGALNALKLPQLSGIVAQGLTENGFASGFEPRTLSIQRTHTNVFGKSVGALISFSDAAGHSFDLNLTTDTVGLGGNRSGKLLKIAVGQRGYGVEFSTVADYDVRWAFWSDLLAHAARIRDIVRQANDAWSRQPVFLWSRQGLELVPSPEEFF